MTHPSMEGLRDIAHAALIEASNCEHRDQSGTASYECSCDTDAALDAIASYLTEYDVGWFGEGLVQQEYPQGCLGCRVLVLVEESGEAT